MYKLKSEEEQTEESKARANSFIYYGWIIVSVCFLVMTLVAPMLASFSVFYVAVLDDLKWSRADTALALSVYFIVSGLASPFAGGLVDKYGPRLVMPIGAVITAGGFLWISQMTQLWHFWVAFGVIGAIGATMLNLVPLTTVVSNWFVHNRGLAIGLVTAGQGLGQVGIPAIQFLIDHIGWRSTYLVLGGVILVVPSTLILLFLHRRPADKGLSVEDEARAIRKKNRKFEMTADGQVVEQASVPKREVVIVDEQWAETEWTIGRAIRTFRFWSLLAVMVMYSVGFIIINVQLVAYLTDKGYSSTLAASVVGFEGLVNIGGRLLGGGLSDRIGREKTITLGVACLILCVLLLNAAATITSPVFPYAFAIFFGLGNGMVLPAMMSATADLFQGKHFGAILGVAILGGYAGGALGAWLSGYFFDLTHSYHLNFLVAVGVLLVSGAMIWKARPGRIRFVRAVAAP